MTEQKTLRLIDIDRDKAVPAIVAEPAFALYENRLKRAFDVVGALGLLVLFGPAMLLIAVLVRLDGGRATFGHQRIGADGRPFTCWKFRSMVLNADVVLRDLLARDAQARAEWDRDFKLKNDPRVTRIGAFLRKSSLDELPQLFNVLKGEMSIVGPRPIVAAEVARYRHHFASYTACRPGLTGLWQVSGRSDIGYDSRVAMDVAYVRDWSFFTDILITLKTAWIVLRGVGAY